MAAVTYTDGKEIIQDTAECMRRIWISPSTMDSADTVIVPTVTGATLRIVSAYDNTDGDSITATVSSFTITLDASGGATDSRYVIEFIYVQG